MSFVPSDGKAEKCAGCGKTAYPNERIAACSAFWHKICLKCSSCSITLNLKTVESFQNKPYCKVHKPNPNHTQVTDSVVAKTAAAAPKVNKVSGVRKDERMTFAPGSMQPIRGPGGPGPRGGPGAPRGPGGPGPARGGPAPSAPKAAVGKAPSLGLGAPKVGGGAGKGCPGCGKTVYPTEEVRACNASWHKVCLKCTECGLVLNLKTVESFQNKPYCKVHKPNPKHTQVIDSVAQQQVKNAPKAARVAQGVKKDTRMTFAPGSMQPITHAEVVNPGGVADSNAQSRVAPQRSYVPPEPTPSITYGDNSSSYSSYDDEPASSGGGYGGYGDSGSSYEEPQSSGGYDQGGYDEPAQDQGYEASSGYGDDQGDQGGYDQGGYGDDQGGYDQGGYGDDQGGYDQGGYGDDQGGYDQGGYDQGGYGEEQGEEDWS